MESTRPRAEMMHEEKPRSTIVGLLQRRLHQSTDQAALRVKRSSEFETITWHQLGHDVCRMAGLFHRLELQPEDRVVLVSENRYEWIVVDLALFCLPAVHVPMHATLSGMQMVEQINHCRPKLVLLSTAEQAAKLAGADDALEVDPIWLSLDPLDQLPGGREVRWIEDLLSAVEVGDVAAEIELALQRADPNALATILYTSGTTGRPKGVMLSQHNLASNTLATIEAFGQRPEDVRLNFLPFSHIFARTCDFYTWVVRGSLLGLAQSRDTILADCAAIQPTLINGVPYFFDKIQRHFSQGDNPPPPGTVQQLLGGNVRLCCSGGAPLADNVVEFFEQQGLPLLNGYGLTETSPVIAVSTEEQNRRGSAGKPIPGVEVSIAEDGEILTRGPHVMMGYYNDPQATAEVLKDGWLHTGDLGRLDDDGFLYITGRKKELIVTSGGKNVVPSLLEARLLQDPLILQAMVVGEGRNWLGALIVPDPDRLRHEILQRTLPIASRDEALVHPEVRGLYEQAIQRCLADVSHHEQVRGFALLDRGFTPEQGELTPKLSLRREVIAEHFAEQIESIYR